MAEHIVAALDAGGGFMDQLCRLLLAADTYQVILLRNHCLAGLAQAFQSLHTHTAWEQAVFEAFVDAVAPKARLSVAGFSLHKQLCRYHARLCSMAYKCIGEGMYLCSMYILCADVNTCLLCELP